MALVALVVGAHSTYASQLNLLPMLQISGEYSDNVFFSTIDQHSDTYFIVNPGVALDYASRAFVGSLAYQAGLQRYVDFGDRDNTVQRVDANVGFNLSKGWFIDATDNLFLTTDPLAFDASGDRVQRDSYIYNHFTPGIAYQFGGRGFRVAARYDRIDVDYDTLIDSYQNGFGITASAKAGSRSTISFDFMEFRRHFDQQAPEFNVIDYTGRRYGVRGDRRFSPRFSMSGFVGYEDRVFEIEPELRNFDSFIYEAQLIGEFPDVFSWMFGFSQRLNDLAVQGAYKVQRVTFDARRSFGERVRAEFNGYWQDSVNEQLNEQANYLGFRAEGQYMVAKFLNVWLGYNYTDRNSDTPLRINPYTENRINFGFTLSYGL
jgi:hypothetical protein